MGQLPLDRRPTKFNMSQMHAQANKTVLDKYLKLEQKGRIQALYIWIDGTGEGLRSKTKTLEDYPNSVADLPIWNYDGSSCYQAEGSNSDTYLHPVKFYPDPFRGGRNIMVMCETYKYNKGRDGDEQEEGVRRDYGEGQAPPPLVWTRAGYGYLENRRPSSNCDPYSVTKVIVQTVC